MIRHLRWAASAGVSRRRAWAGVVTFLVLFATGWIVAVDRAKYLVRETLGVYASVAVIEVSRGSYHLDVSGIDLKWWQRTIAVRSVHLTTNTAVNDSRPRPLPETRLALDQCAIRGLHMLTLVLGRGLSAESMGCRSVRIDARVPPSPQAPEERVHQGPMRERRSEGGFLVLQRRLNLPRAVPRIRIRTIDFPNSAVRFTLERRNSPVPMSIRLDRLAWKIDDVNINPRDSAAANRPLFSDQVTVLAGDFSAMTDSSRIIRFGGMQANFTDSTITLREVAYRKPGRTSVAMAARRVAALGIDFRTLAAGEGIEARKIAIESLGVDVLVDKTRRKPPSDPRPRDTTAVQWIRSEFGNLAVDTLGLTGDIALRERRPGRTAELHFADLDITAANIRHVRGRSSREDVMTLAMSTRFQRAALLRASFEIPLDAPRGDMRYRGSLGAMDARLLNRFVEPAAGVRITTGRVTGGIRFDVTVRGGVARGTITPLYDQLRVKVIRKEGRSGILGSRGTFGAIARRMASFVANNRVVRDDNPDNPGEPVRVGRISRVRRSDEKLTAFVWEGLRDGLISVIRK